MPKTIVQPADNPFWEWYDELPSAKGTPESLDRRRDYTREFLVKVKLIDMGPTSVGRCPGLPLLGSVYEPTFIPGLLIEVDPFALMVKKSAKRRVETTDEGLFWVVSCEYSTDIANRTDDPTNDNPEAELADISWDQETVQEARQFDLYGRPYRNSAMMPFSPPMTFEVDYPILHISRNELTWNFARANSYSRCLNDAPFLGVPRGCVQLIAPTAVQKDKGGFRYWRASYKFRFRSLQANGTYYVDTSKIAGWTDYDPVTKEDVFAASDTVDPATGLPYKLADTWQPLVLDQGMYRLGQVPGDAVSLHNRPVPIYVNNQQIHQAVPLDGDGQQSQPDGDGLVKPWYLRFYNFRYIDMTALLVNGLS